MQKYQQVCIHNIYMYVQYTLIQFTSLPLLICALIKTQSIKSHYTVLPEGEVPINYKFPKFPKGIAKNNDNI